MSEVKGTLLTVILAITVFSIVFGLMAYTFQISARTVAGRYNQAVSDEPDVEEFDPNKNEDFDLVYTIH